MDYTSNQTAVHDDPAEQPQVQHPDRRYKNVGAVPGPTAMGMLDLSNPDIDWVKLANSMGGAETARATTMDELSVQMRQSFRQHGRSLSI
ncbi:hypothetical protein [Burkholderia contaminans]|uniref:Uncharacterized protein n=1 Tax=Burkholderia contaminans TaxID=488447 RepID=A0A3N8R9D3_9BURK|nr:hypothetical protein [Burkholderia contaminans]RQT14943.1 hypothetical protein DF051_17485 [Burkholderia contaminans]